MEAGEGDRISLIRSEAPSCSLYRRVFFIADLGNAGPNKAESLPGNFYHSVKKSLPWQLTMSTSIIAMKIMQIQLLVCRGIIMIVTHLKSFFLMLAAAHIVMSCTVSDSADGSSLLLAALGGAAASNGVNSGSIIDNSDSVTESIAWSEVQNFELGFNGTMELLSADMNEKGDVVAVYMFTHDSYPFSGQINNSFIYASIRKDGVWYHPADSRDTLSICYDSPGECYLFSIRAESFMDESGNASVVFSSLEPGLIYKLQRRYFSGTAWEKSEAAAIDTYAVSFPGSSLIDYVMVSNPAGEAVLIWKQNFSNYISRYQNGIWDDPAEIETENNLNVVSSDSVILTDDHRLIVAQKGVNQAGINTYTDIFSGPAASPVSENFYPENTIARPGGISADPEGHVAVSWHLFDAITYKTVIGMSVLEGGIWTHPVSNSLQIGPAENDAFIGCSAINSSGKAVSSFILEKEHDGQPGEALYLAERKNGEWSFPDAENYFSYTVSGDFDSHSGRCDIDNSGNIALTWITYEDGYQRTFHADYRNGRWYKPQSFSENNQTANSYVFLDEAGTGIIIWEKSYYNGTQVIQTISFAEYPAL